MSSLSWSVPSSVRTLERKRPKQEEGFGLQNVTGGIQKVEETSLLLRTINNENPGNDRNEVMSQDGNEDHGAQNRSKRIDEHAYRVL